MTHQLSKDYWVILPAYNEGKKISDVLKNLKNYTSNIIVVNDGSRDNTSKIASLFTPHVLNHVINLGKGAALKTGCEFAFKEKKAEAIIMLDADAQHEPKEIFLFEEKLKNGADLILGTRSLWEMPFVRSMGNRVISVLIVLFFGRYIPDILSGYKAMSSVVFSKLNWTSQGYAVELEIAARIAYKKLKFTTVPISTIYHDSDKGMTMLDTIELLTQLILIRLEIK